MRYFGSASPQPRSRVRAEIFPELAEREREVLARIAAGRSNQEIADELFLTVNTSRNYISNIFSKLQVADRVQTALRACEAGFGPRSQDASSPGANPPPLAAHLPGPVFRASPRTVPVAVPGNDGSALNLAGALHDFNLSLT